MTDAATTSTAEIETLVLKVLAGRVRGASAPLDGVRRSRSAMTWTPT